MRKRGRKDSNQTPIVEALRLAGATVAITSGLGSGFPDLVVGFRAANFLLEIKDGDAPMSQRRLTPDEQKWHDEWRGKVWTVMSVKDALHVITTGRNL